MKQVICLLLLGFVCNPAVLAESADETNCQSAAPSGRIVFGTAVYSGKYRYMLSMRWNGVHACGAVVLTYSHAVTAGHCAETITDITRASLYGNSHVKVGPGVSFRVIRIAIHPRFVRNQWPFASDYNIAVLRVPTMAFSGYQNIAPISIEINPIPANTRCFILGWGSTTYAGIGGYAGVLHHMNINIVSDTSCAALWSRFRSQKITPRTICATAPTAMACNGDDGGPLVCGGDKLAGILSFFEPNCGVALSTGFTKIGAPDIRGFLLQQVKI